MARMEREFDCLVGRGGRGRLLLLLFGDGGHRVGSGAVAGFRDYHSHTNSSLVHFTTTQYLYTAHNLPRSVFHNRNETPSMKDFRSSGIFAGGNINSDNITMNLVDNIKVKNEPDTINIAKGVGNDDFRDRVEDQGLKTVTVKDGGADVYYTSPPTDVADDNSCNTPATPQDTFILLPGQRTVDPY